MAAGTSTLLLTPLALETSPVRAAPTSATLEQCANGSAQAPNEPACDPESWVSGNLGASKSHYLEGDSIPYRMRFGGLAPGSTHAVDIEWDTTKAGKHALDYLTTFDRTVTTANPCALSASKSVPGCSPGSYSSYAIPSDPQVASAGVSQVPGEFRLYGGTITAIGAVRPGAGPYSYDEPGFEGDRSASIRVTFTAGSAEPVLAWGGHIAARADWGSLESAVAINGSPYHMRLLGLDGSGGNQDRSLSAEAVIFPSSLKVIKDAAPDHSQDFAFTASDLSPTSFSLDDDSDATLSNEQIFSDITSFGTKSVTEGAVNGWALSSISCTFTGDGSDGSSSNLTTRTLSIEMEEGQDYVCTFTNTRQTGLLRVIKQSSPASPSQFSLHVTQGGSDVAGSPEPGSASGTDYTLPVGTYLVSESGGPAGYTADFSGCGDTGSVLVLDGQTTTCTIVNRPAALGLVVAKSASPTAIAEPGGTITFTVDVTNSSAVAVTIVSLVDDPYGPLSGDADCQVGTALEAGASCSFDFTATVTGNAGTEHTDTVTVVAKDAEDRETTGSASATVTITDEPPSIDVAKSADVVSVSENAGGQATYTVRVSNSSIESVTITAIADDPFGAQAGGEDCQVGTVLAAGASCEFSYTGAVPAGDASGEPFVNTVSVTAQDNDGNEAGDDGSAIVDYTDDLPSLAVDKSAAPDSVPENTGGSVTYTVRVSNLSGESVAVSSIADDRFPHAVGDEDCQVGTVLAAGASCEFSYTGAVPPGDASGEPFVNTVSVTAQDNDGNEAGDDGSAIVDYTDDLPSLAVDKSAAPDSVPENTGGSVTYTVRVSNLSGESVAVSSIADDRFPHAVGDEDCQVGTVLAAGASCEFSYTGAVPPGDASGEPFVNTVTVTAQDNDGNEAGDDGSASVDYDDDLPSLAVDKSAAPDSVPENTGGSVTYTVTVTNLSGESVTVTSIADDPFGAQAGDEDCQVGTVLAAGASCEFSYTGTVTAGSFGAAHVNTVTVTAEDNDGNETGDDGSAIVEYSPVANLVVSKVACPSPVAPGGELTYTITASNDGNAASAQDTTLVDTLPSGTSLLDADDGAVGESNGLVTISWSLGPIDVDESVTRTVVVLVTAPSGTTLQNSVTLTASSVAPATATTDTLVSDAGAATRGSAFGADLQVLGVPLVDRYGNVSSEAPSSPDGDASELAGANQPGLSAGLLRQSTASTVDTTAQSTASSTVAGVSVLDGLITADVVKGVSQSIAGPMSASHNVVGSTFTNLKVNGAAVTNVNPNTTVNLKVVGLTVARAVLLEQTGNVSATDLHSAEGAVNMIHVTMLAPFAGLPAGAEIIVAHADSEATYPSGTACGRELGFVTGEAFSVFAHGAVGGQPIDLVKQGDAVLPALGGSDSDEVNELTLDGVVSATSARNSTSGAISTSPNSTSRSQIFGLDLLDGLITADVLDVMSTSSTSGAPTTALASTFTGLRVGGVPIVVPVAPNTTIQIPQSDGSVLLVVLNEQVTTSSTSHTEGTVNAVHIYVLKGGEMTAEVVVASAHSGAHLGF
ncbi:MAG: choice-of-anchor P family protein [Actinomycetota bacterium]